MATGFVDKTVQSQLGVNAGRVITPVNRGEQRRVPALEFTEELWRAPRPGFLERELLQRDTHGLNLAQVVDRQLHDVGADVGYGDDQPLLGQLADGFTQGCPTDLEPRRQRGLDQRISWRQVPAEDGLPKTVGDLDTDRRLGDPP